MYEEIELLVKYPLIEVISEADNTIYKGLINIETKDYNFYIIKMKNKMYQIETTNDLLPFKEEMAKMKFTSADNVTTILDQMKAIISSNTVCKPHSISSEVEIYRKVLYEYSEFTRFYINLNKCTLSCDLRSIHVIALDEQNRSHELEINVDYNENQHIFYVAKSVLPTIDVTKPLFTKYSSLIELYRQFLNYLEIFQEFWDLMDLFDKYSHVIDPEAPTRSHCYRRIKINLDRFPLRDFNITADHNLLKYDGECSICFSLRLDDKLPEVICQNLSCENLYHVKCLYEWLISVNSTRMFNEVSGKCPNCEKNILCPRPT